MNGMAAHEYHSDKHPLHDRIAELEKQRDELLALLVESRSSVGFDQRHYEKLARAQKNIGDKNNHAESECCRTFNLLEKIDAAIASVKESK